MYNSNKEPGNNSSNALFTISTVKRGKPLIMSQGLADTVIAFETVAITEVYVMKLYFRYVS